MMKLDAVAENVSPEVTELLNAVAAIRDDSADWLEITIKQNLLNGSVDIDVTVGDYVMIN